MVFLYPCIAACVAAFFFAGPAMAGAWLQPVGHGQAIAQTTYYTTHQFFDTTGRLQPQASFTKYEMAPYAEYGLRRNLTVGGTAYVQQANQSGDSNLGIADPQLFARSELWGDDHQHLSLQPLVKFASRFEHAAPPRGGSRSTDLELSLLYGRNLSLLSNRDYLDLRGGYRFRLNRLNDQALFDAALGLGLGEHWLVIPAFRQVLSTGTSGGAFRESGDLDYTLSKLELTAQYALDDTRSVSIGAADHVAGAQTGSGFSLTAGFSQAF